jgi:competence protein ComEA
MAGSFVRPPSEATFSVGLAGDGEYILREASAKSDQADSAISGWRGLLLGNPLDPGSATAEDLMALPGVGEKTALKILATREKLGGFSDSGDIRKTPGIGKVRYGKLKEWLTVSKYKDAEGEK